MEEFTRRNRAVDPSGNRRSGPRDGTLNWEAACPIDWERIARLDSKLRVRGRITCLKSLRSVTVRTACLDEIEGRNVAHLPAGTLQDSISIITRMTHGPFRKC